MDRVSGAELTRSIASCLSALALHCDAASASTAREQTCARLADFAQKEWDGLNEDDEEETGSEDGDAPSEDDITPIGAKLAMAM